mmetsp:Transcript_37667/g.82681  ORF Transcript_37667/g.82681 Transcript_37667/m.82681 type:complete len:472 (-) Transcript_37667:90-1505(-)
MRTETVARILLAVGLTSTITSIVIFFHIGSPATDKDNENQPSFFRRSVSSAGGRPRVAQLAYVGEDAITDYESPSSTTLIVGGTDGSGTRSVVHLLDKLGVPITADNAGTLDTNGHEMGGWPSTVRLVMDATRTADYQVSDLPKAVLEDAVSRVHRYWSSWRSSPEVRDLTKARTNKKSDVGWAFKAPVSMLLLPIFLEVAQRNNYGKVKFLHVVRDGRDIAYSGNQSPVKKFYNVSFPVGSEPHFASADSSLRAIHLWSMWNTQVRDWEQNSAVVFSEHFDYFILHIEDLVSLKLETRRAAISSVAKFVGAPVDYVGLCCLATQEKVDLGSHTNKIQSVEASVESRYGKWRSLASTDMISKLNAVGREGLKAFGYEPYGRPSDQINPTVEGSCDFDACKDWTAPQSLMARLSRWKRMQLRERLRQKLPDRRTRRIPTGMKPEEAETPHTLMLRERARVERNRFRKTILGV